MRAPFLFMFSSEIQRATRELMSKFQIPGLVVLARRGEGDIELFVEGGDATGKPVTRESLFIVASVTKLATALTVLRLVDLGVLGLDDALAKYLPDAKAAQEGVTLRTLLCHTAGLPRDLPNEHDLYGTPMVWGQIAQECLKVGLEIPPRTRVAYGNVGYGLLALVVEHVTVKTFLDALREMVLEPLAIDGYLGDEPTVEPAKIAGVRSRHVDTDLEPFNSRYYRLLGLPWSGLITKAEGALKLVRAYAGDPPGFLPERLRREAISSQTNDLPGGYGGRFDYPHCPWGLGVDLRGDKMPHWTPKNASPRIFGHAGASGCVVWHDPDKNVSWVIVGTRTADNAWLVRGAPGIAEKILASPDF